MNLHVEEMLLIFLILSSFVKLLIEFLCLYFRILQKKEIQIPYSWKHQNKLTNNSQLFETYRHSSKRNDFTLKYLVISLSLINSHFVVMFQGGDHRPGGCRSAPHEVQACCLTHHIWGSLIDLITWCSSHVRISGWWHPESHTYNRWTQDVLLSGTQSHGTWKATHCQQILCCGEGILMMNPRSNSQLPTLYFCLKMLQCYVGVQLIMSDKANPSVNGRILDSLNWH